MQGKWVDWHTVMSRDFSWNRLFAGDVSDAVLRFAINSQCLSLPSEDNLRRWGKARVDSRCLLEEDNGEVCGQTFPTAAHVLTGCKVALAQGRYKWRHDSVLLVLKQHLVPHLSAINSGRVRMNIRTKVQFLREGGGVYHGLERVKKSKFETLDEYLAVYKDWQVFFDLSGDGHSYTVFPPEIASTAKLPDVLVMSRAAKFAVCFELTCPVEERIATANELKENKYLHLVPEAAELGWKLHIFPVEVGCRGFVALSTMKMLRMFGFSRSQQTLIKRQLEIVSLRCSYYLFCTRKIARWEKRPLLACGVSYTESSTGI